MSNLVGAIPLIIVVVGYAGLFYVDHAEREMMKNPSMNYYSAEAYENCAAMGGDATAKGYKRWTCHPPTNASKSAG